ncbi:MAG: ABC transporter substrate-binding protein [Chloroflexota bacterium]
MSTGKSSGQYPRLRHRRWFSGATLLISLAVAVSACGGAASASSSPAASSAPASAAAASPSSAPASSAPASAAAASPSASASAVGGSTLVVGTSADFPPLSFKDPANPIKPQGFEIDMIAAMMKHLNQPYQVKVFSFSGLLPALQAGHINMIVSDLYIKPEREKVADFVPYLKTAQGVLAKQGNPAKLHGYMDLCGKAAGGVQGSVDVTILQAASGKCTAAGKQPIKVGQYPNLAQELIELGNGRLVAIEEDELSLGYLQKQNQGKYEMVFTDPDAIQSGIAVKKGDPLLGTLKSAFAAYRQSGQYAKDATKWGIPKDALLTS